MNLQNWYEGLITKDRYKGISSVSEKRDVDEEAISDRARIIYSSAFRRLQQKTQVFTRSNDASVRTRLTHSLEVASTGRWIAQKVVDNYLRKKVDERYCAAFGFLVETACLAHDIGNPPFGHSGEQAIQEWFREKWGPCAKPALNNREFQALVKDFLHFDGNPQGIRILTRLQGLNRGDREKFGMDLTYSQVLTALKYPRTPQDNEGMWEKAGFFESERSKIKEAWSNLKFPTQTRFPLAYLVEAADDISYCISDMEDGIDRNILKPRELFYEIKTRFENKITEKRLSPEKDIQDLLKSVHAHWDKINKDPNDFGVAKDLFFRFKTEFSKAMIGRAAHLYRDGSAEDIAQGKRKELFDCPKGSDARAFLKTLKEIAQTFLYPSDAVQTPFLAGRKIIHGILDGYNQLLTLPRKEFALVRKAYHSPDRREVKEVKKETLLPLLDRLPLHYLEVYDCSVDFEGKKKGQKERHEVQRMAAEWGEENWEWFCRAHLIVDYLAGMTDDFAYRTYQIISGARLE